MANLKEDWIDFGKLEQELNQAVEKDARYWRENDAKFRAVEQRVETYEQFRDIVKAAHIKPLEKKDKIGEGKRNQPWNPYTSKSAGPEPSKSDGPLGQESRDLPKNAHEFAREWKTRCKTGSEKYGLLTALGADQLGKIFRAEIGFGLLGDFISVLDEEFCERDWECIAAVLESLARTNRFGLSVDFLSSEEKRRSSELLQKLEQACLSSQENMDLSGEPAASEHHSEGKDNVVKDRFILLRKEYKS